MMFEYSGIDAQGLWRMDSLFQTNSAYVQLFANWLKKIHSNMDLQIHPTMEL